MWSAACHELAGAASDRYDAALRLGADVVVHVDADGQHDPSFVPARQCRFPPSRLMSRLAVLGEAPQMLRSLVARPLAGGARSSLLASSIGVIDLQMGDGGHDGRRLRASRSARTGWPIV